MPRTTDVSHKDRLVSNRAKPLGVKSIKEDAFEQSDI